MSTLPTLALDKRQLYRLPWSLNDNPIAWLEVTDICNLRCEGCYRQQLAGHKPLDEIREELAFFCRWRNPDNVSIAGGEPLLHPHIADIIAHIAAAGIKPILLTNAQALTPALVRELRRAGLAGFTIHIDSHQRRPGWEGASEADLNALRQHYAEMIAAAGRLVVLFNSTVYPSTAAQIPDVVRWGAEHMDIVHGLVFITYRTAAADANIAYDPAGRPVDLAQLSYAADHFEGEFVTSPQVAGLVHAACPAYWPCAYLGGSVRHDSYKWLIGVRIGAGGRIYGSLGPKTMELAQTFHHLWKGTYLAYLAGPAIGRAVFGLAPFDATLRRAARAWLRDILRHPRRLLAPVRLQSIGIIQAPDQLPDGRADMCDSCPDMTVYNGTLINSCRMDEYRLFGGFLTVVPAGDAPAPDPAPEGAP